MPVDFRRFVRLRQGKIRHAFFNVIIFLVVIVVIIEENFYFLHKIIYFERFAATKLDLDYVQRRRKRT